VFYGLIVGGKDVDSVQDGQLSFPLRNVLVPACEILHLVAKPVVIKDVAIFRLLCFTVFEKFDEIILFFAHPFQFLFGPAESLNSRIEA